MEHTLESMDIRLTEMEDKIDSIDKKLTQVVDAILGNPLTKSGGVKNDLEDLHNQIDSMRSEMADMKAKQASYEVFKNRVQWTIGLVIVIGGILQFVLNIYKDIK